MVDIACKLEKAILESKDTFFRVNIGNITSVINNLKFVYQSVIASENLLSCAIEKLKSLESDCHNEALCEYFTNHLEEERGHDKWLANDLGTHGVDLGGTDEDAIAMIGSQYYMIFHKHPASLLGYLAVAEGTPTPIREIEKLESVYGKRLFRFARFHSIKDEEHKVDLFRVINNTPPHLLDIVFLSANNALKHMRKAARHWA